MVKALRFAAISAIFLFPFVCPHSVLARTYLSYQEAAPPGVRRGSMSTQDFIR